MTVQTSDFNFELDERLIAQEPLEQRQQSRLMRLRRDDKSLSHHVFGDLPLLLRKGDLLVLNDTAVIPAKFLCQRSSGGKIEGLFLREECVGLWEVMLKNAGRCRPGESLTFAGDRGVEVRLHENLLEGRWRVRVSPAKGAVEILEALGSTPLPPYIRRASEQPSDRRRYQTVYARRPGAVAAPTAGLHFTPELLGRIQESGVELARVTLHVGPGTFLPVKVEDVTQHPMHREWYELPEEAARQIAAAREQGRRVVAVGTTSVRVLETIAAGAPWAACSGWTDIFLYPPATFRSVDAMITNFHLPRSTLLMLVSAFASPGSTEGIATILAAYRQAMAMGYRFFSYGDAMLIE